MTGKSHTVESSKKYYPMRRLVHGDEGRYAEKAEAKHFPSHFRLQRARKNPLPGTQGKNRENCKTIHSFV